MNKVELEARVDALQDEINFLRAVYDAVRELERLPLCFFFYFPFEVYYLCMYSTLSNTFCAGIG